MLLLIQFLLAHLLGDFLFQPERWVVKKELLKLKAKEFYFHVLVHGALLFLVTLKVDLWLPILIITLSHLAIDAVKMTFQNEQTKPKWFFIDQILHIAAIVFVWYAWAGIHVTVEYFNAVNFWTLALCLIFLTIPSSHVIKILISRLPLLSDNPSITDAGKYIGMIERVFILVFMITNHWQAIGFMLAAKTIFRFGDLKGDNRKLTEYVLIGTLLSFGLAVVVGILLFYQLTDRDGKLDAILILGY